MSPEPRARPLRGSAPAHAAYAVLRVSGSLMSNLPNFLSHASDRQRLAYYVGEIAMWWQQLLNELGQLVTVTGLKERNDLVAIPAKKLAKLWLQAADQMLLASEKSLPRRMASLVSDYGFVRDALVHGTPVVFPAFDDPQVEVVHCSIMSEKRHHRKGHEAALMQYMNKRTDKHKLFNKTHYNNRVLLVEYSLLDIQNLAIYYLPTIYLHISVFNKRASFRATFPQYTLGSGGLAPLGPPLPKSVRHRTARSRSLRQSGP